MQIASQDLSFSYSHGKHNHKNHGHSGRETGPSDSFQHSSSSQISFGNPTNGVATAKVRVDGPYYDAQNDQALSKAYYGGGAEQFDGLNGSQLYDKLNDLVTKTHHPLPYKPDNYLYPQVDRHPDGQLYCIYSDGGPMFTGDSNHGEAAMTSGYNCEHVVPQSWFGKKSTPRGDLHHLFAAETECNSIRGNATYGDFNINGAEGYHKADHGALDQSHNSFSPEGGKGDVARATLYFMMRYPGQIGDEAHEYHEKDIPMLVKWAQADPPSEYEKHRNQQIQKLQGNRNPLVDFPDLVGKVDFTRGLGHC